MKLEQNKPYLLRENVSDHVAQPPCTFSYQKTMDAFVFSFCVEDADIYAPFSADNDPLYDADAVEVFFSPNGSLTNYYELELSPDGVRFFAKVYNDIANDYNLTLKMLTPAFTADTTRVKGGYTATIRLPIASIEGFDEQKFRLNAYRLDYAADGTLKQLQSLNPTRCGSFHRPEYFVRAN